MILLKNSLWLKVAAFAVVLLVGRPVFATPVRCSAGYQDSTCTTAIVQAPQQAPTCPAGAGSITVTPANWTGSGYTKPQCENVVAPTCPSGEIQSVAPTWTGATWTGLQCVTPAPPPPVVSCTYVPGQTYVLVVDSTPAQHFDDPTFDIYETVFAVVVNGQVLEGSTSAIGIGSYSSHSVAYGEQLAFDNKTIANINSGPLPGYALGPTQMVFSSWGNFYEPVGAYASVCAD